VAPPPPRVGTRLTLVTATLLILTVGFTNVETPRLWIPFLPLLLLGLAVADPVFRCRQLARDRLLLAALVALQIALSAVEWVYMDMRESETRLLTERFFN
jgi:hypothetical protein